ncbi:MAG: protein O-mannosyl-transferase family [Acidobacteriaceae bacterium]
MILIPTYNEKQNIARLIHAIRSFVDEPILVIDDDSEDGTGAEVKDLSKSVRDLYLFTRKGRRGFASACIEGMDKALNEYGAERVITMDGDLSHEPQALVRVIEGLKDNDLVIGSRYIKGGQIKNWPLSRRILSFGGNLYARTLTGSKIKDLTSGFIGYRADFLKTLPFLKIRSSGYAYLMEMKLLAKKSGGKILEIPIVFTERREGKSKISRSIISEGFWFVLKVFLKRFGFKGLFAVLVFAAAFSVYAFTAPSTVYLGDSPEFTGVVATMGIAHPPGYPVYVLLAKLGTFLPFGNIEYRVALASGIAASLGLVFFYLLLAKLFEAVLPDKGRSRYVWAAAFSLMLSLTDIFWSQAIMAKMYSFVFLWLMLVLFLFLKWIEQKKWKYIYWIMFLFGLGLGIHQMTALFFPMFALAFIYLFLKKEKSRLFSKNSFFHLLAATVPFLLGLSVYLYLPIRSAAFPLYDWGHPATLPAFLRHFFRSDYKEFGFHYWNQKPAIILTVVWDAIKQFSTISVFAVAGLIVLWKSSKRFLYLTLGIFLTNILAIVIPTNLSFAEDNHAYFIFYFIPAYAMVGAWAAAGAIFALNKLSSHYRKAYFALSGSFIALSLILLFLLNFPKNNLGHFSFLEDYTKSSIESIDRNGVFLATYDGTVEDSLLFSITYEMKVKKVRPDVLFLENYDYLPLSLQRELDKDEKGNIRGKRQAMIEKALSDPNLKGRAIFTSFIADGYADNWHSVSNGLIYKLVVDNPSVTTGQILPGLEMPAEDEGLLASTYFGRDLLANYYYSQAALKVQKGNFDDSQTSYIRALKLDNQVASEDAASYRALRAFALGKDKDQ